MLTAYYKLSSDASFIQDDAFTSLRYVQNFVDGNGLVFNIGERVEGYTNFLWVLLLSAVSILAHALNPNLNLVLSLPFTAQFLSTLCGIPLLAITYLLAKKIIAKNFTGSIISSLLALSAPAMVLFSTPFIYWSVSGMETPLFVSLTLLSIYYFLDFETRGKRYAFVVVSVLNSFLRPEGMFFFGLLIGFKYIVTVLAADEFKLAKKLKAGFDVLLKTSLIIYAVPVLAYIVFRLVYYGYPFPNTFYAKTEFTTQFFTRGWNYYLSFLEEYLLFGFFYIPVLVQLLRSKTNSKENVLIGLTLVYTLTIIIIGGDVLPVNRFFLTIMPLLFILFISSSVELIEEFLKRKLIVIAKYSMVIILIGYSVFNYSSNLPLMMEKRAYETGLVSKMKIYAVLLKEKKIKVMSKSKIKTASVAVSTIGAFSFYSGARVIDLVGLTDEYIAHNPKEVEGIDEELPVIWKECHYNAGYVLSEKPDYIIFPAGAKPSAFAECAIYVQEEFRRNYYMQLFYSKELNQLLPVFTRLENVRSDSADCGSGFVKHYIEANNLFLSMIKSGDKSLIRKINNELDAMFLKCSVRIPEVKTLKGMTFYHAKNYIIAEKYLRDAAGADSTNAIARIYLKNIYFSQGKIEEAQKLIPEILRFSPGAIPGFEENIYTGRN